MAGIGPPESLSGPRIQWHQVYQPTFFTNIAIGTLEGGVSRINRGNVEGLSVGDMETPFDVTKPNGIEDIELDLSGEDLYVVSDDAADVGQVMLAGIVDEDGAFGIIVVSLNGTTPVQLGSEVLQHCQSMTLVTGDVLQGTVFVSNKSDGVPVVNTDTIPLTIPVGVNSSTSTLLIGATNQAIIIPTITFTMNSSANVLIKRWVKVAAFGLQHYVLVDSWYMQSGPWTQELPLPLVIGEGDRTFLSIQTMMGGPSSGTYSIKYARLDEITVQHGSGNIFPQD